MTPISRQTPLGDVAALLVDRVESHYGPGPRTQRLQTALTAFDGDQRQVEPDSLAEVEVKAKTVFRHIELSRAYGLEAQQHSPGWPPPNLRAIQQAGANVAAVQREPDGTALIKLTGLAPVEAAASILAGAFALVRHAASIVLDLRDNSGGDPATVAVVVDWLAGSSPRHLFDVANGA
jgi:hypothetical protein